MIVYPDPVVVACLRGLAVVTDAVADRVGVDLSTPLPALRVAYVGEADEPRPDYSAPLFQVEVWHTDELAAGRLAYAIHNAWPSYKRALVKGAVVHGRWTEVLPRSSPDPETESPRFLLTVGLLLSGAAS